LHILDIPPVAEALNEANIELIDADFSLLKGNIYFRNCNEKGGEQSS
jgi:hypothetical protein